MPPLSPSPAVIPGGRKPPELPSGSAVAPMDTVGHPAGQSTSGKKLVFFGSAAAVQPFDLDIARATPLSCTQVGHDKQGLPIGLQLIGRPWGEASLLSVASAVEELCLKKRNRPSTFYDILKT
ncbi:hypothetical protein ZWY2020_036072 [Hordeum vulgare]|nr:hypothetical protein ZWY2020_036072 [Hordeum vulgare]